MRWLLAFVLVAGCATSKPTVAETQARFAAEDLAARCRATRAAGEDLDEDCKAFYAEEAKREADASLYAGLAAAGKVLSAPTSPLPVVRVQTSCTSSTYGNTTWTNCN